MIRLLLTNSDPTLNDIFSALKAHTSDPYDWVEVLRKALRWAESAANSADYGEWEFNTVVCSAVPALSGHTQC
jgi:hypothetical protein